MPKPNLSERPFWEGTGDRFPAFFKAPSTLYYRDCEQNLFRTYFGSLPGARLFKTDLWDEAKNTQILIWAAAMGADVYGIDIASSIVGEASRQFAARGVGGRFVTADLRSVPFAENAFDYIYSMGTIEHFPEYRPAVRECHRVLKKGGRAIIGVPNLFDPFLRPLMVGLLLAWKVYAYGYEKSFSFGSLERVLRAEGFRVVARTGILFIPGWLRILDILLETRTGSAGFWTRPFVYFFARLQGRHRKLGRHGYLIACVVEKP